MNKVKAIISFKTKINNGQLYPCYVEKPIVVMKKEISRNDCNLRPQDHVYYNTDMFPAILKRAYKEYAKNSAYYIDELPENITIEKNGFLSTVRVEILV